MQDVLIDSMRANFNISELCAALGVSKSGYHAAHTRPASPSIPNKAPAPPSSITSNPSTIANAATAHSTINLPATS